MVIRVLSHIGSSELTMRRLGETLTECVQKCWLLDACEKKKDGKKRKRGRKKGQKPGQKPVLRQNKTAKDWKPEKRNGQRQSERLKRRGTGRSSKAKGDKDKRKRQGAGNQGESTKSGRVRG